MSSSESSGTDGTAQIGVTGLAVMGSNIARNFANHGYTVALHNRSVAKTDALLSEHGSEGNFVRSETIPEFLAALEKPRRVLIMVKAGDRPTPSSTSSPMRWRKATSSSTAEMPCTPTPFAVSMRCANVGCTSSARASPAARRARSTARRSCPAARGVLQVARPVARGDLRARRRRALLHAHRSGRRRALCQDGAQRHRVFRYAADRRGLPAAARRARPVRAPRSPTYSPSGTRATWTASSSRSPPKSCARPMPRRASRWSTSFSTRPSRRAPAAGR